MSDENRGLLLGVLAVSLFALTLPVTRQVVEFMHPLFIGLGRAAVAGLLAMLMLALTRSALPRRGQIARLVMTSLGVVIGFPLFSAWAMQTVPASHGGIMLGLLPLATAFAAVLVSQERPSPGFWVAGIAGSGLVIGFALKNGNGELRPGDLALLAATLSAAAGYAIGAQLARQMGGWQVICWSLVIALPFILPFVFMSAPQHPLALPISAWGGFIYLAVFSQFYGFFLWYRGMALGGIARVSQAQLLQPFLTLLFSALLLAEVIDLSSMVFAMLVVITVFIGKRMPVYRAD